jgi:single-strand DNA-binding protein
MYHSITIVGNLGRDPELRYLVDGQPVCNLSVAASRGKDTKPIWFRVSVWGKHAETLNAHAEKGSAILFEGRLLANAEGNPKQWTRQDETVGCSFEMRAHTWRFVGSGRRDADAASREAVAEDAIPF